MNQCRRLRQAPEILGQAVVQSFGALDVETNAVALGAQVFGRVAFKDFEWNARFLEGLCERQAGGARAKDQNICRLLLENKLSRATSESAREAVP